MPAGEVSALYPQAVLCSGFDIAASAEYQDGLFTAQDISAMLAGAVLAPKKGETVIDLCAAPGGKTTHLAQLMENAGRILAFDIHAHKIKLIEENAKRMGISIIEARPRATQPSMKAAWTAWPTKYWQTYHAQGWALSGENRKQVEQERRKQFRTDTV